MEIIVCLCVGVLAGAAVGVQLVEPGMHSVPRGLCTPIGEGASGVRRAIRLLGRLLERTGLRADGAVATVARAWWQACPERVRPRVPEADTRDVAGWWLACSLATGAGAGVVSTSPAGVLIGVTVPSAAAMASRAAAARSERARVAAAMPEAFGSLALALGSGHSLAQAMRSVGMRAIEPVRTEFMRVSFSIDCGVAATRALDTMLERLEAPGLTMVALALKISQRTGAPLKDLLAEAARLVGTQIELGRLLDVKTSQARMSARVVACMPVAMIGFLMLLSPDFRHGISTVPGAASVVAALVLNVTAWAIIHKILKVGL